MEINCKKDGAALTVELTGRLDTNTAPQLEGELKNSLTDVNDLTFDLANLEYISSAGLRVVLYAQKVMNAQGKMQVKNVKPEIMEVFEITGFTDLLTII